MIATKVKKEASAPPATGAKAKALKAKKAVLKGVHSHKEKDPPVTHLPAAHDPVALQTAQISWPALHASKFHLTLELIRKESKDKNTFVSTVDVKANKHQIRQAMQKLGDFDVVKVNTLVRPDGEKACAPPAPEYGALGVANKIGVL
ncbi:large ribosomal subunit protein uL23-like [Dasypus novemcinctus]|uniref:large ribosomal subunit protein uL23-like n=1 Tax=Dasypus novemcinctus TaxID=9361 RepID=UPI00265F352E|nr:large ribosomal subunit protein uL23-like [Dasypus novemcinctus]